MSGVRQGEASAILREESNASFTHCYGHPLNMAVADMYD